MERPSGFVQLRAYNRFLITTLPPRRRGAYNKRTTAENIVKQTCLAHLVNPACSHVPVILFLVANS